MDEYVIESNSEMEDGTFNSASVKCFPADNDSLQSSDSLQHEEINNLGESTTEKVPDIDTNVCYQIHDVPSSLSSSEVNVITKSVCKEPTDSEDKRCIQPDSPQNNSLAKINISLNNLSGEVNNFDSGICEDSDSHSDVLSTVGGSTEKVLLELSETCEFESVEGRSSLNVSHERKYLSDNNDELSESFTHTFNMNISSEELTIKEETDIVCNDSNYLKSDILDSDGCEAQINQFIDDDMQIKDTEPFTQETCRESHIGVGNNEDSDTISADEKEEKDFKLKKANDSNCADHTGLPIKNNKQNQLILDHGYVSNNNSLNNVSRVGGPVMYKCINCSHTDVHLEKLSAHVLSCVQKRKKGQNQECRLDGEPPSKARILEDTHLVLPKTEFTCVSKTQPIILSRNRVPVTPKTQLILAPPTQLLTSPQVRIAKPSKTQTINTFKPTQFAVSSSSQQVGTNKTIFAIAPTLVSTTNNPVIINPQTQRHVWSQPQTPVSTEQRRNPILKPQLRVSPQAHLSSPLRGQPVITLQTQLPVVSTAQLTSTSKPRFITSQSPFSLATGTKVTLGPHSQVPVIPQAPLSLPQQGLTIAQAGTQLLITTKPVQQSAGASDQPTLLGLGIGTNPSVVPKNIVLLPNVLLNSVSPSVGKVNGKQTSAVHGQFILQRTTPTPRSVAPVKLRANATSTSQSAKTQSQVLTTPFFTVCSKPPSNEGVRTTVSSPVQKPTFNLSSSTPNCTSNSKTAPTSTTNTKLAEPSSQTNPSLDKFICEICDDSVKDLEKLRGHMKCLHEINIHPKMMPSFNCQKCQFCFFTEQGLERHLVGSHGLVTAGLQEAADRGEDAGRCPICGWGYRNKLLHHVATDHKVCLKPADLSYKCTLCTATFGVYRKFEDHVYSVHRPAVPKLAQGNPKSSSRAIK